MAESQPNQTDPSKPAPPPPAPGAVAAALNPERNAAGELTRAGMEQAIGGGGSVLHKGALHTKVDTLPSEAELAGTDVKAQDAALERIDAQQAELDRQRKAIADRRAAAQKAEAEAAKNKPAAGQQPGQQQGEGDNRKLHGHALHVYRNKVGNKQGAERLEVLKGFDGIGDAKAQEIEDALDGK
jgi:type IV secretory pathway VirB10-like protein